ncbi:MAG: quinone oxidoreductase [Desulfovibrionaceae bacterium]
MDHAVRIHETGGPEVLRYETFDPGEPGPGEVLVRQEAMGCNFIDVYNRTGLYPLPALPAVLGKEGAGVVEAVGAGVSEVRVGDRVAYAAMLSGGYATRRVIAAHRLVVLPEGISFATAAGMMLRGMTARYLLHGCHPVGRGDTVLLHAAAGGVGSIVSQWAAYLGATVIGTVGSEAKEVLARVGGCAHVIRYDKEDFVARVRDITGGRGVDVVYDAVGKAVFLPSLDCLRPRGTMVTFGNASGAVEPFAPSLLAQKGSLFLTRPILKDYTDSREDLLEHARDLFDVVGCGAVAIAIGNSFPLAEAAQAHRILEGRGTHGSTILTP